MGKINKLRRIIGIGVATVMLPIMLSGCKYSYSHKEYSEVKHEDAQVVDVVYAPERHGSDIAPSVGMTSGGDLAMGITSVSVDIPEEYAVVFKCQHGKFIEKRKGKDLWKRLQEGQEVDVSYREIYDSSYEAEGNFWDAFVQTPKPNAKKISKNFVKYDFIDAQPK